MERAQIRVQIIDDHAMVASALASAFAGQPDVRVVGIAHCLADLEATVAEANNGVDVAVVDYQLPDATGIDVANLLAQRSPATRVIIMSARNSAEQLREAVEAGCVAFIDKARPLEDLIRAIRAAADGQASFDAHSLQMALSAWSTDASDEQASHVLSIREHEVLTMLADGLTTEAMATQLYLSQHTVRNHVRNLTAKLGAHTRLEAVAIATRTGLVTLGNRDSAAGSPV